MRLSPDYVARHKRRRVAIAIAETAHERGLAEVTTTTVIKRARISRNTFYSLFSGREDSLLFACMEATRHLVEPIVASAPHRGDGTRRERVEGAVDALLGAASEEPLLAELALVGSMSLDPGSPDRSYQAVVLATADAIGEDPIAELAAHGIVSFVAMQIRRGRGNRLAELREGLIGLAEA